MTTPFERPLADDPLRARWQDLAGTVPAPGAHLSEDDWVQLAAGELDDATRQSFADHIEACTACAEVFRAISHVRAGAAAIDPAAPPSDPTPDAALDGPVTDADASPAGAPAERSTPRAWWYGLAAAAVVSLAVGAAIWRGPAGPEPASRTATAPSASPANTAPSVPATPDITPPRVWAALTTAPAVTLPASFTIVMRGDASPDRDAFLTAFGPAIAPYRAGRYAEAAEALEGLTARFPAVDEAWFYLGVSRLYAGRAAAAVEPLRRARQSDVVAEQALWLEAVALERAGRGDDATAVLREACDADRQSHAEACATLPAPPR
jgi:TolA-binding protein